MTEGASMAKTNKTTGLIQRMRARPAAAADAADLGTCMGLDTSLAAAAAADDAGLSAVPGRRPGWRPGWLERLTSLVKPPL
jgi:hypothetical protein